MIDSSKGIDPSAGALEGASPSPQEHSFAACLQDIPPGPFLVIDKSPVKRHPNGSADLIFPTLTLYCDSESCQDMMLCDPEDAVRSFLPHSQSVFRIILRYSCRHCRTFVKTYAFGMVLSNNSGGQFHKFGEEPPFGQPLPDRLLKLAGKEERDNFFKGRQCENQGLGIAAFAYYRRIVERRKGQLIDEIKRVAVGLGAEPEVIAELEAASKEVKFSAAIERIKHGLPAALLIDGKNPLRLLHTALSEGLHDKTDKECLDLAVDIREVLTDLVERMELALTSKSGLKKSVAKLLELERARRGEQSSPAQPKP